jgi:hypothetical protein
MNNIVKEGVSNVESKLKILNAVKYMGGTTLTIGMLLFLLGLFESGSSLLTPIGIGTVMGAIFIFLMGVFFVVTEEMLEKRRNAMKEAIIKIK